MEKKTSFSYVLAFENALSTVLWLTDCDKSWIIILNKCANLPGLAEVRHATGVSNFATQSVQLDKKDLFNYFNQQWVPV